MLGVVALLVVTFLLRGNSSERTPAETAAPEFAPPSYLVQTTPLSATERIATQRTGLTLISSSMDPSLVVRTVPSPDLYQRITDGELMLLLAGRDAVIVRQPGRPAMLILDGQPVAPLRLDVN
jgi:hypothetical protein